MTTFALLFGHQGWIGLLLEGTLVTVSLALAALPIGFGGGLLVALLKISRSKAAHLFANAFTTFFRGIPDLLTLFIVYFGLQALLDKAARGFGLANGIDMNAFVAASISLGVVIAAYSSEVWVGALRSVQRGQHEAAYALGMRQRQVFRLVVLPQLIRVALPGLGNNWMVLIKETSLVSTLAVMDLLRAASEASKSTSRPFLFFGMAALIYLVFSLISIVVWQQLERRASRGYAA